MAAQLVTLVLIAILSLIQSDINDAELIKLLTNDRIQFDQMTTKYIPIPHLWQDIWQNAQLSMPQLSDSIDRFPAKMALNSLISPNMDDIEVILSENDLELVSQLMDGFEKVLKDSLNGVDMRRYLQFVEEMSVIGHQKKKKNHNKAHKPAAYNMNGAASDYRYVSPAIESTGIDGKYWRVSDECIKHKGCNIYPIFRVIHKSKPYSPHNKHLSFSCHDILTLLLPQIYECIDKYGVKKCPLFLGTGLFRWVFKAKIPDTNHFVAVKMMKQTREEKSRDLLRHLRETIFLYYLRNQEIEYMKQYPNATFKSNLGEMRAFPYVYEVGHCIYPSYISVSHLYNMSIDVFIDSGAARDANISQLVSISLQIAQGIELLHNIAGGPYHHTDIRDDQFMIDDYGNVLINDFNRGKFQPYFFPKDDYRMSGDVERCNFCPHSSHGNMRAPEEQISKNLDETIDVYSAALVIWKLFAASSPFGKIGSSDLEYVVYDTARRPPMPYNMPFALKQIIQSALSHDPKNRPSAKQFSKAIQNVFQYLDQYTRGKPHFSADFAMKHKVFRDRRYPHVSSDFPEFVGKDSESQ